MTAVHSRPVLRMRSVTACLCGFALLAACAAVDPQAEMTRQAASFTATLTSTPQPTRTFSPTPAPTDTPTPDYTQTREKEQELLASRYLNVCRGTAIEESAIFDSSRPPFPLVICDKRNRSCRFLDESGRFRDLLPSDFDPDQWNPESYADLQLVLCFDKEVFGKMGYCNYKDSKNNTFMVPYGVLSEYWNLHSSHTGRVVKNFAVVEGKRVAGCPRSLGSIPDRLTGVLDYEKFALTVLTYLRLR